MTKKIFVIKNTQLLLNKPKTKKKSKNRYLFRIVGGGPKHIGNDISNEKQIYIEAKHTKDSENLACSTLCLLSRAFLLKSLRWVRGSHFIDEKSKLADREIFRKKKFLFFFY
jgi:hypothetical protein